METPEDKIRALEASYNALLREAQADGVITPQEQEALDRVGEKLRVLQAQAETGPTRRDRLSAPVGAGGRNLPEDVTTVQSLLNDHGAALVVDGVCGPATVGAISQFQAARLGFRDGRVDPDGQTWAALTGQGAPTSPATPSQTTEPAEVHGDSGGRLRMEETPADPQMDLPTEEASGRGEAAEVPDTGEVLLGCSFGSIKVTLDADGDVQRVTLTRPRYKSLSIAAGRGWFAGAGSIAPLSASASGSGTRERALLQIAAVSTGALKFGPGAAAKDLQSYAIIGFDVQLSGAVDLGQAEVDLRDPRSLPPAEFGLPLQFALHGKVSGGIFFKLAKAKGLRTEFALPLVEYKDLYHVTIAADLSITAAAGPGLAKLEGDLDTVFEAANEALDDLEDLLTPKTPKQIEPGGLVDPDALEDALKQAERQAALDQAIATHAEAEGNLANAYAQFSDPQLLGKANALAGRDRAQAAEVYGLCWNQRVGANDAYQAYVWGPPAEQTPEAYAARSSAAQNVATRLYTVVGLFQAADAQW